MADGDRPASSTRQDAAWRVLRRADVLIDLPPDDLALVQVVVEALRNPLVQRDMRRCLDDAFEEGGALGFKAYLALAPFGDGDLDMARERGPDRDVDIGW